MPRLIFKCRHVKGGTKRSAAHLNNLVYYVATREGVERIEQRENYVGYIARRVGSHGLFTAADGPLALSHVAEEVANHPGTVWLPIISLQREDAARLGYDNAEHWRQLLAAHAPAMARCATNLLHHVGQMFQEQTPAKSREMSVTVDSKLRRIIREKKITMGHKADDHEQKM